MESQPNSSEKASESKKDAFPISENPPKKLPKQQVDPVVAAPAPQQNISANPHKEPGECQHRRRNEPLLVHVTKDDELSSFERRTVRVGLLGIGVAAVSILVTSLAAYFVYQQFLEMNTQTGIISSSADRARVDSAASGIATAQQLMLLRDQLAQQDRGMRQDQRAWLGVGEYTGSPEVGVPEFMAEVKNTGKTPARDVEIRSWSNSLTHIPDVDETCRNMPDMSTHGQVFKVGVITPGGWTHFRNDDAGADAPGINIERMFNTINQGKTYYHYGCVRYEDVFGSRHWVTYCVFWQRREGLPSETTRYVPCEQYNQTGDGSLPPRARPN